MRAERAQMIGWVLWWMLLLGAALLFFADRTVHSDEGNVLNMAWHLWHGRQMYTGFSEFVTPGSGYFLYWVWELVGNTSYLAARISSILFWFVSALALGWFAWRQTRAFFPVALASVGWMVLTFFHPLINYNTHSSFVAIVLLAVYWWALKRRAVWQFILVGALLAVLFLFLQTKGVFVACALLLFHLLNIQELGTRIAAIHISFARRIREVAVVCVTAVAIVGLVGMYWGSSAFYSWFVLPFRLSYLQHSIHELGTGMLQIGVVLIMLGGTALYARFASAEEKTTHVRVFIFLLLLQSLLFASSVNLIDLAHTAINAFPFLLFVVCLLWWCLTQPGVSRIVRELGHITLLSFAAIAIALTTQHIFTGAHIYTAYQHQHEQLLPELFKSKQITDAEYIYAGPFLPGFYYELGKVNLFTDASNMTLCDPACEERAIRTLQEAPVEIALIDYIIADKFGYSPERELDAYIREHYELCGAIRGRIRVYALNGCTERY